MSFQHRPLNGTDRIPAEIIEQILSNTKDTDTQTLHACCFVCVGWHSYLIDPLYETIHLASRSQLYRLVSVVRIYPAVRHRISSARALILWSHRSRPSGFVDVFPLVLGSHLHKVQDLTLHNCFRQPLQLSFFVMLPQLKNVKHLVLSGSPPQNLADFQRIVRAFPQLEELDIADLREPSWNASQLTPPHVLNLPCVSKLACLRVSNSLFRSLVVWLSSSGVCSSIRMLYIFPDDVEVQSSINALLAHTASTLEHLRMSISIESTYSLLHAHSRCHIAFCRIE